MGNQNYEDLLYSEIRNVLEKAYKSKYIKNILKLTPSYPKREDVRIVTRPEMAVLARSQLAVWFYGTTDANLFARGGTDLLVPYPPEHMEHGRFGQLITFNKLVKGRSRRKRRLRRRSAAMLAAFWLMFQQSYEEHKLEDLLKIQHESCSRHKRTARLYIILEKISEGRWIHLSHILVRAWDQWHAQEQKELLYAMKVVEKDFQQMYMEVEKGRPKELEQTKMEIERELEEIKLLLEGLEETAGHHLKKKLKDYLQRLSILRSEVDAIRAGGFFQS